MRKRTLSQGISVFGQSLSQFFLLSRRLWRMSARCFTALVGGYDFGARFLGFSQFLIFASLGLWAFHERRLWKVAKVIWGGTLLSAGIVMAIGVRP